MHPIVTKDIFFVKPIQWDRPIEPSIQILVRRFVGFTQFTKWDINRHGLEIEVEVCCMSSLILFRFYIQLATLQRKIGPWKFSASITQPNQPNTILPDKITVCLGLFKGDSTPHKHPNVLPCRSRILITVPI